MRYVIMGARIIEGVIFLVFGLNALLHFFNPPPPTDFFNPPTPPGDALTWSFIMAAHHWINFIAVVQLIGGLLLVVNRFVPLALAILAPVIVNILLFHALLWPQAAWVAILVLVMQVFLMAVYWRNFAPLLQMNPEAKTPKL